MSNKFLHITFVVMVAVFLMTAASSVLAMVANITYPISELGDCNSQKECGDFCEKKENHMFCVDWAESQGIFTNQKAKRMKDINRMQEQVDGNIINDFIYMRIF